MKTCYLCKEVKEDVCFAKRGNGLQSSCRDCQAKRWSNYYSNPRNRKAHLKRVNIRNTKLYKELRDLVWSLKDAPCKDCDKKYPPWVMEFDHINIGDKVNNVAAMYRWNKQRILDEIAKCELVCANCHRERTHSRLKI